MTAQSITDWLISLNFSERVAELMGDTLAFIALLLLALIANLIAKKFIQWVVHPIIHKTVFVWDDLLIQNNVITRLSHIIPASIMAILVPMVFEGEKNAIVLLEKTINAYVIVIVLFVTDAALNFMRDVWQRGPVGQRYPAKSFTQAAKIVINMIGLIFILSVILGKSPLVFISGLGAVTAILLLVFRDAILGFVAGFQLSVNHMVMVGDWIEMPDRGADGDVIDVSLTTVKVQNWDKTITTIPTYALISDSFKNWRGMSESGGRRIKRSLNIDMNSIRFVDEGLLSRFKDIRALGPYIDEKLSEISKHNEPIKGGTAELINGRHLTNVGTFRAYCLAYLRQHPKVHQEMTLLVRQLAPTEKGLPLEIYVFTNDIAWSNYENIQSDIFDHLLSILPEFDLSAYQAPSGTDIAQLKA
ncbi:mechanosensitive ion channel family protein [Coraliomargarita akajimensis]|uniref:Mechanosensing system component YbdG n=1 Tax=Coraliomargarita akajimensis (strain DSM 45221 / IAM 15411 / JCM 23193 / KCTC 12865 / 04OKA010-24) TaxID=583355 RepID=D5EHR7_CORAD|nr:mechanosensitive ion channel domain-containing protein [Coraliomargarita akajimensis]ADE54108.1 MscS Mechanosensitive ion channel [Coraliomargarita akajimensis DSM 45221]